MKTLQKNFSDIIKKRIFPGILIFDLNLNLIYFNSNAQKIIPPLNGREKRVEIPREISKLCRQILISEKGTQEFSSMASFMEVIISPSRSISYSARASFINLNRKDTKMGQIIVLLERIGENRGVNFEKAKECYHLTKREIEVTKLIFSGLSNKEIAEELFISEHTAKDHVKNIKGKLKAKCRSHVIHRIINPSVA